MTRDTDDPRLRPRGPSEAIKNPAGTLDGGVSILPHGTDAAGELDAWAAAVIHLHRAGLPAAVPAFPAAWLRRRGIRPDWVAA